MKSLIAQLEEYKLLNRASLSRGEKVALTKGVEALMTTVGTEAALEDVLQDWKRVSNALRTLPRVGRDTVDFIHCVMIELVNKRGGLYRGDARTNSGSVTIARETHLTLSGGEKILICIEDDHMKVVVRDGDNGLICEESV